ncbi:MmcQ/YjbR family DNA-binding protein [Williamsia sterculiae]|nr:MmcQ/YjbR family DNA-binding protein [Williamsia sterculiae]
MPHPIMFDDADPVLGRIREIALAFPEATEVVAHGRPTFRCGKMFATYGGMIKGGPRFEQSVLFIPDAGERDALLADPRFFHPAYVGPSGWLGMDLTGAATRDSVWTEVGELLDASFRQIAPARVIRLLGEPGRR